MMVARRLAVLGDVNAGKASTLAMMGAELDRVRAAVWARFSGAKTAHLSKRQVRDQLMGENAPKEFGMPQRLWRATVEDTVDKIRAWQQAVIATELRPTIYARAGEQPCAFLLVVAGREGSCPRTGTQQTARRARPPLGPRGGRPHAAGGWL
jgi:hypothetical protein